MNVDIQATGDRTGCDKDKPLVGLGSTLINYTHGGRARATAKGRRLWWGVSGGLNYSWVQHSTTMQ